MQICSLTALYGFSYDCSNVTDAHAAQLLRQSFYLYSWKCTKVYTRANFPFLVRQ